MSALLWLVAGVVQLAAVVVYYAVGFGMGFVVLEGFVFASFALTWFQIEAKR